jgi:hypothetical protein
VNAGTLAAALLGLAAGNACADVLVGADGSRLQGTLVATRDGRHVFDSSLLGRVEVPVDRAKVERGPAVAVTATPASPWATDVSMKLGIDRGSLKTPDDDLDATLRLERRTGRGEWLGVLDYSYRRTDDVRKDDDITASLAYDRLRGPRSFVAGRLYGTRELRSDGQYDATQTASLALGWRGWEGPERYLRIGPSLGYLAIDRGDAHFDGGALGLYARGRGPVVGKVTFNAELQFLDTLGEGRYADLALQLRHPLGEHLYLALAWDYTWSDFDIESGVTSEWHWVLGWKSRR